MTDYMNNDNKHLFDIINNFISNFKQLPQQGTKEWITQRSTTIGGSEISTITGDNPYQTISDLVLQKIGLRAFEGNIYTNWGSMFENVVEQIVLLKYGSDISQTCSIGSLPGAIPNQSYSPDGIGVIKLKNQISIKLGDTNSLNNSGDIGNLNDVNDLCGVSNNISKVTIYEYLIGLYEFKCPLTRHPNGTIPPQYLPQIKTGLDSIKIADIGVFMDCVFRRCSLDVLSFSNDLYDTVFHQKDIDLPYTPQTLACGIIGVYSSAEIDMPEMDINDENYETELCFTMDNLYMPRNNYNLQKHHMVDFGKSPTYEFINLVNDIGSRGVYPFAYYSPIKLLDPMKGRETEYDVNANIEEFKRFCNDNGYISIGVIPYKLIHLTTVLVERDDGYVKRYKDKIDEVVSIIIDINASTSISEKKEKFRKYYPNTRCVL